jgi:site-specific DNA-methyltransferase (adenine-specific)
MTVRLIHGECVEAMRGMADGSVDAVVTDPPFNWSFMGKTFDNIGSPAEYQRWSETWGREALRVLKPGGFALVCGGDRTYHRQTCGLEDAGFRPRTCVVHLHGQGFPKHKWQLKPAAEFWALLQKPFIGSAEANVAAHGTGAINVAACRIGTTVETWPKSRNYAIGNMREPGVSKNGQTESAGEAPPGRFPANLLLSHSPGCREVGVRRVKGISGGPFAKRETTENWRFDNHERKGYADPDGCETVAAWECEPNCPIFLLDSQSGERTSGGGVRNLAGRAESPAWRAMEGRTDPKVRATTYEREASTGGASRFFATFPPDAEAVRFRYVPKASRRERSAGLEGMPERDRPQNYGQYVKSRSFRDGEWIETGGETTPQSNVHPCVKPVALMRWLVRLVTPPTTPDGKPGLILDPFAGSGSTLIAAVLEGFDAIGIEQDAEYVAIAERRVAHVERWGERWLEVAGTVKQGAHKTVTTGTWRNIRECNVCQSRSTPPNWIPGDDRPWPACGHDDWSWVAKHSDEPLTKPTPALTDLPLFRPPADE